MNDHIIFNMRSFRMKHKNKFFLSFFLLFATNQVFAMGSALPALQTVSSIISVLRATSNTSTLPLKQPTAADILPTLIRQLPIPIALNPEPPAIRTDTQDDGNDGGHIDQIRQLVENSTCADYSWKGRGVAPVGYINGVALSYTRSLCRVKNKSPFSSIMTKTNLGNTIKDALALYQPSLSRIIPFISNNVASGSNALRAVYTLGMGLGMRESSGNYCNAEAGIFQTSFDSINASTQLSKLYAEYKANPSLCLKQVFQQGASCSGTGNSSSNLGTGAGGAEFQAFNKSCPAFATEYAMMLLRVQRSYFGPINRKEVEVVPSCNDLLKDIEDLINNDPYICDDIL